MIFNVGFKWNFHQIHWVEKHQCNQNHHWTDYIWVCFSEFVRIVVLWIIQLHYLFKLLIIQNFELRKFRSDFTQDGSDLIIESRDATLRSLCRRFLEVFMFLLTLKLSIFLLGNLVPNFDSANLSTLSSLILDERQKPTSCSMDFISRAFQESFVLLLFLQWRLFWIYWNGRFLFKEASVYWQFINFWLTWDLTRGFLLFVIILKLVCN